MHQSAKENASGTITAIVENQAENPEKDFLYHSDAGDPVSITVTGSGSNSESSNSQETIDGVLISADIRTDNASGSAYPGASLYFEYSDETKSFGATLGIKAVGSYNGRMYSGGIGFGEWKDYGGDIKDYSITCGGGGDVLTDKNCGMSKSGNGYQGSWNERESKIHHTASGPEYTTSVTTVEITVMPYKESDKPEITMLGCSELGVGDQSMVVATGKPEGGTFRFWAEPASMMTVETDGSSANLTGVSPERGTLFVEYTTADGKTAQTSQAASCVKVEKYNDGQSLPQIALYDIDGKKLPGMKTVSVEAQPENASELLRFEPADPGVLTAVGVGNEVTLQGLHIGTTTLQAKTKCGEKTGPSVEVEVVNCDDETKARLKEMMDIAVENQKQAYKKINEILGSEEFNEAADNIKKSTIELAEKTAITIAAGGENEGAVETAVEIVEMGASIKDLVTSRTGEDLNFNELTGMMKVAGSKLLKAAAANLEIVKAATEFGKQLGTLIGTEEELQNAIKWAEQANKQIEEIVRKQRLCQSSQQPTGEQKPPTAQKTDPVKPAPTTKPQTAQTQGSSTRQPPAQEPATTRGSGEVSPPPPTSEPRQVGLPYDQAKECGCSGADMLKINSEGFAVLQTGMQNLGKCVDTFTNGPLADYTKAINDWQLLLGSLETEIKKGPASFQGSKSNTVATIDELISRTNAYDEAGKKFTEQFKSCPQSMQSGTEFINSAKTITIDSINTHY